LESIQRQLSEYLQCELYHLLGAYGVAEKHLGRLAKRLADGGQTSEVSTATAADTLTSLVDLSRDFNGRLALQRYASDPLSRSNPAQRHSAEPDSMPAREPMPAALPLTDVKRFKVGPKDASMECSRRSPWSTDADWGRIARYYCEAIAALEAHRDLVGTEEDRYRKEQGDDRAAQINFARSLLAARDGESRPSHPDAARAHLERRIDRYRKRLRRAVTQIGADHAKGAADDGDDPDKREAEVLRGIDIDPEACDREPSDFLELIVDDEPVSGEESLSMFVVRVLAEAHLSMHAVEAWRAMCLGENAETVGAEELSWLEEELERSIALDTFAYCVSRTAPWIFARSKAERDAVIRDVAVAWENVVPLRCMWIASQIGLLSLHRRAYARALQDRPARAAYDDYHKLQHLIRDAQRRIEGSPLQVGGAHGFLAGLNAEAHHHIGELYRSEHAHKPALEHFEAASHRLERLRREDRTFDEVLTNSRWYVELQISHGKACYEMGRHKEALCWHLKAWQAFLELLSSETETETNAADIEAAIDWLDSVKFEPELRKCEISEWIEPVVEQLDRISPVGRLGGLAAEILLRLGHLLFVINIDAAEGTAKDRVRRTLAFPCLAKAAECDPYSTLIGSDLLKLRMRFQLNRSGEQERWSELEAALRLPKLKSVSHHWPRGGSDYERLARGAEYLMLRSLGGDVGEGGPGSPGPEGLVARDLLLDLFMSTDSINVRKSQIHRFLMEVEAESQLPCDPSEAAIEFICMRRYSSAFPLLPRPSAFRALGGGYFARLHAPGEEKPFGVVVDPGVDFVENLYRTGYSLGDIDMIVITHDHVDHLGGLDPLLSLLHVRAEILKKEGEAADDTDGTRAGGNAQAGKIAVLTSRSVDNRYKTVHKLSAENSKHFSFVCFEDIADADGVLRLDEDRIRFPAEFEIVTMSSVAGADPKDREKEWDGHRDLSNHPSHGICLRRVSDPKMAVAVNSDTPPPPPVEERERFEEWERTWSPALDAAVMVVHLGSVPLTELRRMDGFEDGRGALRGEEEALRQIRGRLEQADPGLPGQIEYAQWLRSHLPRSESESKLVADIVGAVPERWLPPPEHNYLVGLLRWALHYRTRRVARPGDARTEGLFVVGELSEELGTMRGKVATRINQRLFRERGDGAGRLDPAHALTADIGLHVCVRPGDGDAPRVEVLCTTCNLDTDRTAVERYHPCCAMSEVCVKGENEGIFYNCAEHDPARQTEPAFLEQLERFDIFGR